MCRNFFPPSPPLGADALRDAKELVITDEQFTSFVDQHMKDEKVRSVLVPEDNAHMKDSYLILDEHMSSFLCAQKQSLRKKSTTGVFNGNSKS